MVLARMWNSSHADRLLNQVFLSVEGCQACLGCWLQQQAACDKTFYKESNSFMGKTSNELTIMKCDIFTD